MFDTCCRSCMGQLAGEVTTDPPTTGGHLQETWTWKKDLLMKTKTQMYTEIVGTDVFFLTSLFHSPIQLCSIDCIPLISIRAHP